ncbi:MAG: thioredoxin domain-containing protein [Bryobacteraceae bacterium]|jgi:protein-disulfide isomerase
MKSLLPIAMCATLALLLPGMHAQVAAAGAGQEPGITRQQADQILQELRQIRQLLERQQQPAGPPAKIKMNLEGAQMLGSKDAPVTMVEFTDYQCPYCQAFHTQTFGELKKNFIDTGKVRFYSRDLPLDSMHPDAMRAAEAGRCAAAQGQFWKLRDIMSHHPDKLDLASLLDDAEFLKLDVTAFRACVVSERYKNDVQADMMEAMRIGSDGTPAFVVGKSTAEGIEGDLLVGAQPYNTFDLKLRSLDTK